MIYNPLIQEGQTVLKPNPPIILLNWSSLTLLLNLVVTIRGDISFAVGADNTPNYLKPCGSNSKYFYYSSTLVAFEFFDDFSISRIITLNLRFAC